MLLASPEEGDMPGIPYSVEFFELDSDLAGTFQ